MSTHRNHLLKSPFVIHPKTGKVCVPMIFDVTSIATTLILMTSQILRLSWRKSTPTDVRNDASEEEPSKRRKVDDVEKTSMKPYIDRFEKQFLKPMHTSFALTYATWLKQRPHDGRLVNMEFSFILILI